MHASIIAASALFTWAFAAPTFPVLNTDAVQPGSVDVVSEYFNILAKKVQELKQAPQAPVCDMSSVQLPNIPGSKTPLPPPSAGFTLKHIAVGRGTQNYTCDAGNATAVPQAAGALATLFNASCLGSYAPELLAFLPRVAVLFNLTDDGRGLGNRMAPSDMAVSGHHYFAPNFSVPFFDLNPAGGEQLGSCAMAKLASESAPADAPRGQLGEPAVPWLKLTAKPGATGDLQEVYRVQTAGGSAPGTCEHMPAAFEVQYSAQYWFYAGTKSA